MKNHNVIVYSTPSCPYCVYAKNFFKQNGIAFKDVDVSSDQSAGREMVAKSGQMGVPVVDIDGTILVGFQPEKFAELLK
ncbi:MAG: glutaredoxin domain-containing protein [Candidatus Paceibacterota bacterium]|jgi:glutaredoxin-like YruB-family protein